MKKCEGCYKNHDKAEALLSAQIQAQKEGREGDFYWKRLKETLGLR